jgi:hypothetical protein
MIQGVTTLNTGLGIFITVRTWKVTRDEQISRFHNFENIEAIHIRALINISYNKFRKKH